MGRKPKKHPGGRPTVFTESVILKLEQAFALGCSDREACFYAGVATTPFYEYCKKNPKFRERKELLKESPILAARQSVLDGIIGNPGKVVSWIDRKGIHREVATPIMQDPNLAMRFLERKKKDEFGQRYEHTGPDGESLFDKLSDEEIEKERNKISKWEKQRKEK